MVDFPIFFHIRYDAIPNEDGKLEVTCTDVSGHDFVEVVRCRDCRYDRACLTQQFVEENSKIPFNRDEFFCPDGKRRETE